MYNIQGERHGEVGDNETLKTLNFQYPMHELDANRKLRAAKDKADAKVKGADDKELNKVLKYSPKVNDVRLFGQEVAQKETGNIYNYYKSSMENLRKTGQLNPYTVRALQTETDGKLQQLEIRMKGATAVSEALEKNAIDLAKDPTMDSETLDYEYGILNNKLSAGFMNGTDFSKIGTTELFAATKNLGDLASVDRETKNKITKRASELGHQLIATEGANNLGGVSGESTKKTLDAQIQALKDTELGDRNNLKFYGQEYRKELKKSQGANYKFVSNEELANDPVFQKYMKTDIDKSIDATIDYEKKQTMSVNQKDAWGNGFNRSANTEWRVDPNEDLFDINNSSYIDKNVDLKNSEKIGLITLSGGKVGGGKVEIVLPQSGRVLIDGKTYDNIPANNKASLSSLSYGIGTVEGGLTNIKTVERQLGDKWTGLAQSTNGNSDYKGILDYIKSKPKNEQAKYAKEFTDKYTFNAVMNAVIEDKDKVSETETKDKAGRVSTGFSKTKSASMGGKSATAIYGFSEYTKVRNLTKNAFGIKEGDAVFEKMDEQAKSFSEINQLSKKSVYTNGSNGGRKQQEVKKAEEPKKKGNGAIIDSLGGR